MSHVVCRRRQKGAVILTVAMLMLFLLGFMGVALDFGHLFIVKTELQTAMDSCALAAAQELDAASDALTRASNAGKTASDLNGVNFQSTAWTGGSKLDKDTEITFRDATYAPTTVAASAKYAQCQHAQPTVNMWLMQAMGAFIGDATNFPSARPVSAFAVATRASAQTSCPVPLALKPAAGGVAPDYGFTPGQWITLLMAPGAAANGQIGWANLDGSSSASETEAEMNGFCGTSVGSNLGTPGVQASIVDVWNGRFGIYKPAGSPAVNRPDFTGYAYTSLNWPAAQNAYEGPPAGLADNFKNNRLNFVACGTSVNNCETVTGLSLNSFNRLAPGGPSATGGLKQYGASRRVVTVPVVNGSTVVDFACMLMLQPLTLPMSDVKLEYIGNASAIDSPCTTGGLPGGSAGPLVPTLVR